jgi:GAF domain-containing protein
MNERTARDTFGALIVDLRLRLFQVLSYAMTGLGLFIYLFALLPAVNHSRWVYIGIYTGAYLWTLWITFGKSISYQLRVGSALFMVFILAISSLLSRGLSGEGRFFLLALPIFSTILIGPLVGAISLGMCVLLLLLFALGMTQGFIPLPPADLLVSSSQMTDWLNGMLIFILVGVTLVFSLQQILEGMNKSLIKQKDLEVTLRREQSQLEEAVHQRTQDLEKRLNQLRTATEISQTISTNLNPQILLDQVVHRIQSGFSLYFAGIFLLEPGSGHAVLVAATGEAGKQLIAAGMRNQPGDGSQVDWAISNRKPKIAAVQTSQQSLPLTRSEIVLPLINREKTLGAVMLQSDLVDAFDEDDLIVLQGIANEIATVLENARLFQNTQENLEEIRSLHQSYLQKSWSDYQPAAQNLNFTYSPEIGSPETETTQVLVPLTLRDQSIGQFTLETGKDSLSTDDLAFIEAVTTQTALALENARLLEETQRRVSQEHLINEMTVRFSQSLQIEDILKTALHEISRLPEVSEVAVHLQVPEEPGQSND